MAPLDRPRPYCFSFAGGPGTVKLAAVERLLVGHGDPLFDDAQAALDHALANARWGLPAYLLFDVVFMLRAGYVAMRD